MKRQLMSIGNALRTKDTNLSDALKKAWFAMRLKAKMMKEPVSFFYINAAGEERFAVGYFGAAPVTKGEDKPCSPLVMKYYDTLADGWRSFRIDRLIVCEI